MASKIPKFLVALSIGVPFLIYILHALFLRNWIVDDAGISFVFSRNLALGYGLVSQPGVPPVECYSNFAWVALFTPFFAANIFDPFLTPKIISALLVLLTFIFLGGTFRYLSANGWLASLIVTTFVSLNTSFVVWTSSGLENPLYIFSLVLLLWIISDSIQNQGFPPQNAIAIGLVTALIALVRPEGILYVGLVPIFLILILYRKITLPRKLWFNRFLLIAITFSLIFGGYLLFRWQYFGAIFPNTYYAKGGPTFDTLRAILLLSPGILNKISFLNESIGNKFGNLFFAGLLTAWLGLIFRKNITKQHIAILGLYGVSVFAFLLLPGDWMREYRFATPVILFFYASLYLAAEIWITSLFRKKTHQFAIAGLLIVALLSFSVRIYSNRTQLFVKNPTVPLSNVINELGLPFNRAAEKLGIINGSLLIPDLGGTLYVSNLRIYDLAGLCDATIARTKGINQNEFYDYIFDVAKPTFIHTHFPWAQQAALDVDPRFRDQYLPIRETFDTENQVYWGDYVRKDAAKGKEELLTTLLDDEE